MIKNLNKMIILIAAGFAVVLLVSVFAGNLPGFILPAADAVYTLAVLFIIIIRPLNRYLSDLKSLSEGTGNAFTSKDRHAGAFFEFYKLQKDYLENLHRVIGRLRNMVDRSTEIGENVEGAVKQTSVLNMEVASYIDKNREYAEGLDSEIKGSAQSMMQAREQLGYLNTMITENQSASVNESSSAIEEIIASIKNISRTSLEKKEVTDGLNALSNQGRREMENTMRAISRVAETAVEVVQTAEIINDVAARINLLAMNAAIEAAHAGEAGRGFAVVAAEVKKLAEQTNNNAKTISESMAEMRRQMEEATASTRQTDSSINEISGNISEVADGITEIFNGIQEVASAGEQILKSMHTLLSITDEVGQSSESTDANMQIMMDAMQTVAEISAGSITNADRMSELVGEIASSVDMLREQGGLNAEQLSGIDRELSGLRMGKDDSRFVIGFNDVPPFSMKDDNGNPTGAANDFLLAVLNEMGINNVSFRYIQSLERIYEMLDRGEISAYTLATKTYDPRPELIYKVPAEPSIRPAAGFLMHLDSPLFEISSPGDISDIKISTKNGMPLSASITESGAAVEFIGGEEPLQDCLKMTVKKRFDAVYSIICTELEYMAGQLGLSDQVKTVLLPDPRLEIYTAFSAGTSGEIIDGYNSAFGKINESSSFDEYLKKYF